MNTNASMDLVTMNVIENTMISACREMGITLMKTSYSTIFNEALDFTGKCSRWRNSARRRSAACRC